jgi:aqualysin 1
MEDPVKLPLPLALGAILLLGACTDRLESPTAPSAPAPSLAAAQSLRDRYIVVFHDDVSDPGTLADALVHANGGTVHFRYSHALKGFAATLPAPALDAIRRNPNVSYVEADGIATVIGSPELDPPSWGLDRVDQHALPLDHSYSWTSDGTGVRAYIIDTGIRFTHEQYAGRAFSGYDYIDNDADASDCHGHGTHVAGTVGGNTTGIAKNVTLIAVRVLDCSGSGSYSAVIAGVDWVTNDHNTRKTPAVANMSLGGGASSSVNQAVTNSINAGVVYAVAAGNSGADACGTSPASTPKALTVGATGSNDARASFSNYGSCVDLFAPGVGIYSSTITANNTYASWSGTSMATPHVAGVAALYLSANPSATPDQVETVIKSGATANVVTDPMGTPNLLLYSLIAGSAPPPPPPPPPAQLAHVGDLDGSRTLSRKNWKATVAITVHEASHLAVAGLTVSGSWSTGGTGSCTTGSNGACSVQTGAINNNRGSTTFTVTGISGTGYTYASSANHDPDTDSNGTSIVVNR